MLRFHSNSVSETEEIAEDLAKLIKKDDIIAFKGGLGVGKTTFTRGLVKGLNGIDCVSSPTFALVNQYEADIPVAHFDMYRISSLDDLYSIGFFDYLENGYLLIIEWSENIEPYLENVIGISITANDDGSRDIVVTGDDRFC